MWRTGRFYLSWVDHVGRRLTNDSQLDISINNRYKHRWYSSLLEYCWQMAMAFRIQAFRIQCCWFYWKEAETYSCQTLSNQLGGKARVEHWAEIVKKHVQHNVALRPCHEYPWTMMMMLMIVILYIVIYCDVCRHLVTLIVCKAQRMHWERWINLRILSLA